MGAEGRDPSRTFWQRGIVDPVGKTFYVRKVVIALHVFLWQDFLLVYRFCAILVSERGEILHVKRLSEYTLVQNSSGEVILGGKIKNHFARIMLGEKECETIATINLKIIHEIYLQVSNNYPN